MKLKKRKGIFHKQKSKGYLLLRGVVGKVNTLLDVALEALDGSLEESLLLLGDVAEDVDSLLSTVGLWIC
jgi:hypothetical protein